MAGSAMLFNALTRKHILLLKLDGVVERMGNCSRGVNAFLNQMPLLYTFFGLGCSMHPPIDLARLEREVMAFQSQRTKSSLASFTFEYNLPVSLLY